MESLTGNHSGEIAIIGMAGEFPKSPNLKSFWENLAAGKELITFFSDEELLQEGLSSSFLKDPSYIKAKGYLENTEGFDADFFGFSTREAESLDPQQRRLLEWSWHALEHAGCDPDQFEGLIGVYVCSSLSSYFYLNLFSHLYGSHSKSQDEMLMVMGNEKDFLATRISYKLNLKGPSKSIQTACSSSLVAVHDACQSLLNYECDVALAGGVSITFPQKSGYFYSKEGINSPDGHCRAFDHKAAGTLIGNGGGIVVLKRLDEALSSGDTIHAVIKGSSVNNDGNEKVGYTAPSVNGQKEVILAAQLAARVHPETISYIECHGTGTILGDPVEITALTKAFRAQTQKNQFCAIGSVKTNMGHLDAASGIAGLIKTTLSLKERKIPPTLHFEKPNPKIAFSTTPFYVNNELIEWVSNKTPLRAGVSSFGIGGTNAHLILEEPPHITVEPSSHSSFFFPFSAKNKKSLEELLSSFLLTLSKEASLPDIAFTLQVGRKSLDCRISFIASTLDELKGKIDGYLQNEKCFPNENDPLWGEACSKWMRGEKVNWKNYYLREKRIKIPLPSYPFRRSRYFILPKKLSSSVSLEATFTETDTPKTISSTDSRSKIEEVLIKIWERSLKVKGIGIEDNFFELGGDSLLALEITESVRENFYIDLNLGMLFDHPTISFLSQLIREEITKKMDTFSETETLKLLEIL